MRRLALIDTPALLPLLIAVGLLFAPEAAALDPPPPPDDLPESLEYLVPGLDAGPGRDAFLRAPSPTAGDVWQPAGPSPITGGQTENVTPNNEVAGALHAVVAHPSDANILWAGSVNGGIWRTDNAQAVSPAWIPLTDGEASLSIGALEMDPTDGLHQTLVAGIGRYSSYAQVGGSRVGLLRTTDGGATWAALDGGGALFGRDVSGVAPRGATITLSVNRTDSGLVTDAGIYRTTDGGTSFVQMSGNGVSGLPYGRAFDLASDPGLPGRLYAPIVEADAAGGINGIYRSDDYGATWTKVSSPAVDAVMISGTTNNAEMAVHNNGVTNAVYTGIVNNGQLAGMFRSADAGATWTAMDIPETNEGGTPIGIQPRVKPGAQGSIHFSIVADPSSASIVYVGGDRQPLEYTLPNPTSIGAENYSGRLFRGDASQPSGSQWEHLTHSNVLGPAGGGTASNSAPHADSREMVFDANGDIIEVDDGGIYRRTAPTSDTGDWYSLNGNLQVTELHHVAYDSNANVLFGGCQDTGTVQQPTPGAAIWDTVSQGDGGAVAVDTTSSPGLSIRYSSFQYLGGFRRQTCDAANNLLGAASIGLSVLGGGDALSPQFYTPIALNAADPARMVIGGANSIYESFDRGDTLTQLAPVVPANYDALAYGGYLDGSPNADVLYAGSGSTVYVRTSGAGALSATASPFPGGYVRDIVMDPDDWMTVFAADSGSVYMSTDAGGSWTDITGNFTGVNTVFQLAYAPSLGDDVLVAATWESVYISRAPGFDNWFELGTNLPNALVFDVIYDATDDVLVASTMGRGAWIVQDAIDILDPAPRVVSVDAETTSTLLVTFSEAMGAGVLIPGNYAISGLGMGTLSANPDAIEYVSGYTYRLVWSTGGMAGASMTVTVTGVQDADGNLIGSANAGSDTGIGDALPVSSPAAVTVTAAALAAMALAFLGRRFGAFGKVRAGTRSTPKPARHNRYP